MTSNPPAPQVGRNDLSVDRRPWRQLYGFTVNEVIVITVAYVITTVPGAIANGLMISCILLTRKLRQNTTSILLLNLAIGDFLVCIVHQPLQILLMNDYISGVMNRVVFCVGFCLQVTSLNGMLGLTVDRFIYICYPFRYVVWMRESRAYAMNVATWLVAFSLLIATLSPEFFAKSFVYIVVVFFITLSLQIAIFVTARRQNGRITNQFAALGINVPYNHKPTKGITLVMGAFLFCWLPIMITPSTQSAKAIVASVWFVSLNSLVNPIICCSQIQDVKKALCKMLGFRPRQDNDFPPRSRRVSRCKVDTSTGLHRVTKAPATIQPASTGVVGLNAAGKSTDCPTTPDHKPCSPKDEQVPE